MKTYHYTIHTETLKSRIPGLFPYNSVDEKGNVGALETGGEHGCWGGFVPDLVVNGKVMSYRTLMERYYSGDASVKDYVERGIGKRLFSSAFKNESEYERFMRSHRRTPESVYMATVNSMIEEYDYYHNICKCYKNNRESYDEQTRSKLCCECEHYKEIGGDFFRDWLYSLSRETLPQFSVAQTARSVIPVTLSASVRDLGVFDLYINRWQSGTRYRRNEIVTYRDPETLIDNSYICDGGTLDEDGNVIGSEGFFNRFDEKIYFPDRDVVFTGDGGQTSHMTAVFKAIGDMRITDVFENPLVAKGGDDFRTFRTSDGRTEDMVKSNQQSTFGADFHGEGLYTHSKLTAVRRTKRYINSRQEFELPDEEHDWLWYYKVGQVNNVQTIQDDLGNISTIDGVTPTPDDIGKTVNNLYAYGDVLNRIIIGRPVYCTLVLETTGYAAEYANAEAIVLAKKAAEGKIGCTPDEVRKQMIDTLSRNNTCKGTHDDNGEVEDKDTEIAEGKTALSVSGGSEYVSGKYHLLYHEGEDLYLLWGMISESTEYSYVKEGDTWNVHKEFSGRGNGKINFEYVIGAHLTAEVADVKYDIDGNKIVSYTNYAYDSNDLYHGVIYMEGHNYTDGGELATLAETAGGAFEDYIDPTIDVPYAMKCEFSKIGSIESVVMENGNNIKPYLETIAEYEFTNSARQDTLHAPLMRRDYLSGLSYPSNMDIGIYINRGNAAAFEKHIKLGEIKTMEDLVNYSNGSFFNVQTSE